MRSTPRVAGTAIALPCTSYVGRPPRTAAPSTTGVADRHPPLTSLQVPLGCVPAFQRQNKAPLLRSVAAVGERVDRGVGARRDAWPKRCSARFAARLVADKPYRCCTLLTVGSPPRFPVSFCRRHAHRSSVRCGGPVQASAVGRRCRGGAGTAASESGQAAAVRSAERRAVFSPRPTLQS